MMPGFDELEIYYQLKTNMSTVDEANPAVWEKRLSEIRQLLNKEKNSQAQKRLKSEKNLIEQKINNYRQAEENLLDAYLIYSDNNQSRLESIASPLKENIVRNLRTRGTLSSEELQKLLESPELDFLGGKDCAQYFDNLKQAAEFKKNCLTIRENLEKEQIIPDLNGIEALMKSAGKTAAKQQKEDNQQKSDQKKLEKIKNIAVEEIKNRLAKKALLSDDEKYVITHPDSLERISLQQSEGKTYLNAEFEGGHPVSLRLYAYKDKYFVSGNSPEAIKNKAKTTELYLAAKEGEILFNARTGSKTGSNKIKDKEFKELLGIGKTLLSKEQSLVLKEEAAAYAALLAAGKTGDAESLREKLQVKYAAAEKSAHLKKNEQQLKQLDTVIGKNISAVVNHIKKQIEPLGNREFVSLCVPAAGQNADNDGKRQKFAALINGLTQSSTDILKKGRRNIIAGIQNDISLWNNVRNDYYAGIKRRAAENYYRETVQKIMNGKISLADAVRENLGRTSPALTEKILLRSLELECLGKDKVSNAEVFDGKTKEAGYLIQRQEFEVEPGLNLRSKPLTMMLRSLADGRPFDISSGEFRLDLRDRVYIREHAAEYKKLLGNDANFDNLVGVVLDGKSSSQPAQNLTPYQKRYKSLGLMAAMGLGKEAEDTIFAQYASAPAGSSLETLKKKSGWDYDDHLFCIYADVFFDEKIMPDGSDKIKSLKSKYGWTEFKRENQSLAEQTAKEFTENSTAYLKLAANLLNKGEWSGQEEVSVHHIKPLKYAVCSANPLSFNDKNNLAVTVQWKPWQPDFHKDEHATTIEGLDCHNPYLVRTGENEYKRFAQCDLRPGMKVCYEKPYIRQENGQFAAVIPEKTMLITSRGTILKSPEVPQVVQQRVYSPQILTGTRQRA